MSAMFHPKAQAHYNNYKSRNNKRQRRVSCTNEVPQVHTDSFGSGKYSFRSYCEINRFDVPLESYPGLSYLWDYVWKLFESWNKVIGSGHLYKFFKNGKERFREISEDETIPEEFITFYVIDMSGTFDKTCLLGRNKDIDVTTEVIDLSKHESGLKIKANALIIKQDAHKLAIKELEKQIELTEPFVRDVQQSRDSAFSTVQLGSEFEAKVKEMFEKKMVKLLQTIAEFIKPIIPEDVGDVDFHLIHDKDKLFRTISATLYDPAPGNLRNGKIRVMEHERRFGKKQRSSLQISQWQYDHMQKSTLAKIEIKVWKYLINGLMKRFQLPDAVLIEYLSKFDIISELFNPIQASTRRISTKQLLPNKLKTSLMALMRRVEKAVEKDMNFFTSLKKLYFLLCGMLVDYDNKWKVPSVRLSEKVWRELLSIKEIFSCGSFYGDLTFFVTKPLTKSNKKMIIEVLQANRIKRGYVIRLRENQAKYSGDDVSVKNQEAYTQNVANGSEIYFEDHLKPLRFSTLGCFVNIKRNEDTELHAVSCPHRIHSLEQDVYLDENGSHVFGQESYGMYKPHTPDIATIKISDDEMVHRCEVRMRDDENEYSNDWEFFDGEYQGKPVYKYGSFTDFTKGVVVGEEYRRYIPSNENDVTYFDPGHNLLVLAQSANGGIDRVSKFGFNGDSGSAICLNSNGKVYMLGLLIGGFEVERPEMHITNCIKFGPAIQELQEKYDIIVSPARKLEIPTPRPLWHK